MKIPENPGLKVWGLTLVALPLGILSFWELSSVHLVPIQIVLSGPPLCLFAFQLRVEYNVILSERGYV